MKMSEERSGALTYLYSLPRVGRKAWADRFRFILCFRRFTESKIEVEG